MGPFTLHRIRIGSDWIWIAIRMFLDLCPDPIRILFYAYVWLNCDKQHTGISVRIQSDPCSMWKAHRFQIFIRILLGSYLDPIWKDPWQWERTLNRWVCLLDSTKMAIKVIPCILGDTYMSDSMSTVFRGFSLIKITKTAADNMTDERSNYGV